MENKTIYSEEVGELSQGTDSYVFVPLEVRDYFVFASEASGIRDGRINCPTRAYRVIKRTDEGEFSTVEIKDRATLEEIATEIKRPYSPRE